MLILMLIVFYFIQKDDHNKAKTLRIFFSIDIQ